MQNNLESSKIPKMLRAGFIALALALGSASTLHLIENQTITESGLVKKIPKEGQEYIEAVASDSETTESVKIAMVMGAFYESSYRHVGRAYIDKLGNGEPLTVCNGITGTGVYPDRYYSPSDCYNLEKVRYLRAERIATKAMIFWNDYGPFTQAGFLDFIHNKGSSQFLASTMLVDANNGNLKKACKEKLKWRFGRSKGILTEMPGLLVRAESNDEITCEFKDLPLVITDVSALNSALPVPTPNPSASVAPAPSTAALAPTVEPGRGASATKVITYVCPWWKFWCKG